MIVEPWAKRKVEPVAAQGSNSTLVVRGSIGVAALLIGGLVPEDPERCLASCPADMAKASQLTSKYLLTSAQDATYAVEEELVEEEGWCMAV